MLRALSTAATGMNAQQTKLDVTANNIANVSTVGFKKSRAEFQDLMYQQSRAPGAATSNTSKAPVGLEVGLGVRTVDTQRMHSEGDLQQTGNPLDVAIQGAGFFPIKMPSGDLAYTRAGNFKTDQDGKLVNQDGYPIGSDITIPPDAQTVTIGSDGTVSATVPKQAAPVEVGKIQLATFVNPAGLSSIGNNLYQETSASGTAVTGAPGENGIGTMSQGTLELSNVKIVEEMVDLISGQRAYEVNTKVVHAADEMLQETANLK
jgi:flagellar basal-body rod protein FlgG